MDNDRDHDELLRAAAKETRAEIEARDRERFDRRWDDYCAGTGETPETFPAATDASPEDRLAARLFAPLGADWQAGVVRKIARQQARETGRAAPRRPGRTGWRRRWLDLLTGGGHVLSYRLAAVAAGLVAVAGLYQLTRPAAGPLPPYELRILGAETTRAAADVDAKTPRLVPGLRFDVRLRPAQRAARRPELRVYVRGPGGELERWRAAERAAVVHPDGAITIRDPEWSLAPGDWTLLFAVGAPLPADAELRARLGRDPPPASEHWQLLIEDLRVGAAGAR